MVRAGLTRQRRKRDMAFVKVLSTVSAKAITGSHVNQAVGGHGGEGVSHVTHADRKRAVLHGIGQESGQVPPQLALQTLQQPSAGRQRRSLGIKLRRG